MTIMYRLFELSADKNSTLFFFSVLLINTIVSHAMHRGNGEAATVQLQLQKDRGETGSERSCKTKS